MAEEKFKFNFNIEKKKLIAGIAYCAYNLSPKLHPRKLNIIIDKVDEKIEKTFETPLDFDPTFRIYRLLISNADNQFKEVFKYVHDLLFDIPEFQELNLTENEYKNGINPNDEDRPEIIVLTSAFSKPLPEDDNFIDLDAFCQNLARLLIQYD